MRKIAEVFKYGRTQVQIILKAKESMISDFERNAPASRKRSCNAQYQDVDGAVYDWYLLARKQLVPSMQSLDLCCRKKHLVIANGLGHSGFKAFNGWLQKVQRQAQHQATSGEWGSWRCCSGDD